jgi:hypothetical protein
MVFKQALFWAVLGGVLGAICGVYISSLTLDHDSESAGFFGAVTGAIFCGAIPILMVDSAKTKQREQDRDKALRNQRVQSQRYQAKQDELYTQLTFICGRCREIISSLPFYINSADKALDKAEMEFAEGAFAPFWDVIEEATMCLATFNARLYELRSASIEYAEKCEEYGSGAPELINLKGLPESSSVLARLRLIVRQGQKNFQFASIYEQRKTNKILIDGFSTLGQAINDLGGCIESALRDLFSSVSDDVTKLADFHQISTVTILNEIQQGRDQIATASEKHFDVQVKQLKILDNIQRRKKPEI